MRYRLLVVGLLSVCGVLAADGAWAQDPYALRVAMGSEAYLLEHRANQAALRSRGTPRPNSAAAPAQLSGMTQQARNVVNYFGGRGSQAVFNRMPTRPSSIRQVAATSPPSSAPAADKPFQQVYTARNDTVSPYLNLFREEFEESAPNYFAFVRPQLEQQRSNAARRVTARQSAPAARRGPSGLPTAGTHSPRFGNTGSYYGGWQR